MLKGLRDDNLAVLGQIRAKIIIACVVTTLTIHMLV